MTPIGSREVAAITPERAVDFIHAAPFHIFGGSYWGTAGRVGRARLDWAYDPARDRPQVGSVGLVGQFCSTRENCQNTFSLPFFTKGPRLTH